MFVRLYTGEDGQSHFEDLGFPPPEVTTQRLVPGAEIIFRRLPEGKFTDWHTTSDRHYGIILSGHVGVGIGDGSVRRFGPGDVILEEDLTGRGHTTRIVSGPFVVAGVPLAD